MFNRRERERERERKRKREREREKREKREKRERKKREREIIDVGSIEPVGILRVTHSYQICYPYPQCGTQSLRDHVQVANFLVTLFLS